MPKVNVPPVEPTLLFKVEIAVSVTQVGDYDRGGNNG